MKKEENKYTIQLDSMPFGNNDFQFVIDDSFFGERECSEVKSGVVNLLLNVEKLDSMFILTLNFEGFVVLPCDRCGDDYNQRVSSVAKIFLKYGAVNDIDNDDDDIIFINKNENDFDLTDIIYDYISVSLPMHRAHENENDCNQDVIKYLEESERRQSQRQTDLGNPVWSNLMEQLKDKLDN
ncbi:MAG: YceD family protein [Candidatus Limimorpha sp.]